MNPASAQPDHTIQCLNCETAFSGRFCPQCGQKASTARLRLRQLVRDFWANILDLDSKILRTIIGLTRNPGQVCRDFVSGKRIRYVHPIRYSLAILALVIILNALVGFDVAAVTPPMELSEKQIAVQQAVAGFVIKHLDLVMLGVIPLLAWVVKLLHRKSGFNYAEITVFLLYVLGQVFALGLPIIFLKNVSVGASIVVRFLLLMILFSSAATVFFRVSKTVAVIKSAVLVVSFFLLIAFTSLALALLRFTVMT